MAEPDDEDVKDAELAAWPLACEVCSNPIASRFGKPWWTVRCMAHSPLTYGGAS